MYESRKFINSLYSIGYCDVCRLITHLHLLLFEFRITGEFGYEWNSFPVRSYFIKFSFQQKEAIRQIFMLKQIE